LRRHPNDDRKVFLSVDDNQCSSQAGKKGDVAKVKPPALVGTVGREQLGSDKRLQERSNSNKDVSKKEAKEIGMNAAATKPAAAPYNLNKDGAKSDNESGDNDGRAAHAGKDPNQALQNGRGRRSRRPS